MAYKPPRNVFLLSITSFFNDASSEMVASVLPAFFISVLKAGAASLGLVEGLAEGASNLIKMYSGRLSDLEKRRKPLIIAGYSLAVLTRPFYLLVSSVSGVIGLRVLDRVGKGLRDAPRDAAISLSTPKEELGTAFGYHRMWDTMGAIVGPLIAFLILAKFPGAFNTVFISAFILGVFAVVAALLVKDVVGTTAKIAAAPRSYFAALTPSFKRYLIALFFLSFGSLPTAVLLLKTQNFAALTLASIPLFYMLYNVSYASFSLSAGKMSDKVGAKRVITLGYCILVAGYVFLAFAENPLFLAVGFLILGLFPALTDGVQRALAANLSAANTRGEALGLVNAISGLGLLFAGIGGGYVWAHFGANTALLVAGVFVFVGISIFLTISHREPATI